MVTTDNQGYILHILVVGFHHKKGCQVEFCYPSISDLKDDPERGTTLPEEWKALPSLALPDGAHNFEKDNVYFILPPLDQDSGVVYGIACYRQIDANTLLNKTADMTRNSVQKSVVVLSTVPLFGAIRTRLEGITESYFLEGDFSKVGILRDTFESLRVSLTPNSVKDKIFTDLPIRVLLLRYRHSLLVLFKLILLERRVVFFMTPVEDLTSVLLSLLSLFPELVASGLSQCTRIDDTPVSLTSSIASSDSFEGLKVTTSGDGSNSTCPSTNITAEEKDNYIATTPSPPAAPHSVGVAESKSVDDIGEAGNNSPKRSMSAVKLMANSMGSSATNFFRSKLKSSSPISARRSVSSTPVQVSTGSEEAVHLGDNNADPSSLTSPFETDEWGFPLAIFTKSSLFCPYVSLQHIDLMENPSVRSFVIGANNMLFKSRRNLIDAVIGEDESSITIENENGELKKALQLTTADLRFTSALISLVEATPNQAGSSADVTTESEDDEGQSSSRPGQKRVRRRDRFVVGESMTDSGEVPAGWEGSDDWVRMQFRIYLQALLLTVHECRPSSDDFNSTFVRLLRRTHHYRVWRDTRAPETSPPTTLPAPDRPLPAPQSEEEEGNIEGVEVWEHPGRRQWHVNDIKLRMNHLLSGTEQGRKLNSAVQQTGRMVTETGKVVGVALTSARSAVTSFWSGLNKSPSSSANSDLAPNDPSKATSN